MKVWLAKPWVLWALIALLCWGGAAAASVIMQKNAASSESAVVHQEPVPAAPTVPHNTAASQAEKPLSNRIVEYHMSAEYDPATQTIKGVQTVTWTNPGAQPVQDLYLHMYPNAFSSKKTTFMQESGGKLRSDKAIDGSFGSIELTSIKTEDGLDLSTRTKYVQPDDDNVHDHTLLQVLLPSSIAPGGKTTFSTTFTVKLPFAFARMGVADDFVMAGQWFPKIAVYEPAGTRGRTAEGWNLHQYHGNSEFYADFGIYDIKIKVPTAYTVAATGFPIKPPLDDGKTRTYQFYADDVHDFAWAASPQFKYYEEKFSAPNLPGVKIKLYLDPKHDALKTRYFYAAKRALARYSQWYGTYPYSTLSIVVPPESGNGAGGMEYPTLITAWGASNDKPDLELERVVVHEIGHQFWYGLVATNEFEEAWLDEGFTSYSEDRVMEAEYGVKANLAVESSYITSPQSLQQNAWDYKSHSEYADNVYTRGKLVLRAIEQQVGRDKMDRILRTYFQRWQFKHPSTRDFQKTVEDVTKSKWDDFFNQYVYNGGMMDYAVESIHVRKIEVQGTTTYESAVLIRKRGGSNPSVPIHFHFTDGTSTDKTWSGQETQVEFKLSHTSPVDWVIVDPSYSLVLDNKHINNYMKTNVDAKWKVRWNIGFVQTIETIFSWLAW
jgi:hypothetical protein